MKLNVSETESNWFSKKCKRMSTKQEIVSDSAFKAWSFSSDFNFPCKDGRITAATCEYYCPLAVNPTLPIFSKSSISNVAEFLDPSLKTLPCTKASPVSCENQSFFFIILKCCHRKSFCFSLLLFTI